MPKSDLTHARLKRTVATFAKVAAQDAEAIRILAKTLDDEAQDTARVAEGIAALNVDPDTVAETRELAKIMAGISEATLTYASGADTTAKRAQAAHDTAGRTHDGIDEAFARSTATGVYDLNRSWLSQE